MTLRIAIGGFMHESHSFAPRPTAWEDFLHPGGFPPFQRAATLLDTLRPTSVPAAGAIAVAEEAGVAIVPLTWCFANPAGPVQDAAFERIAASLIDALAQALEEGPLDGVYLDLHGAAVVDSFPDAEGELLRRVRAVIGDLPLTISLDPHCNLTAEMVARADVCVPFRTYPHVDMKAAGAQAMRLLFARIERGRPWARAHRTLPFWIPLGSQCTLMDPMQAVMTERAALAERMGAVELAFCFGFPYADFEGCAPALAAFADTPAQAEATADAFLAAVTARESEFVQDTLASAAAVAEAKRLAATRPGKPVVLADTQDNPGGGGHGDTTELLSELVRQGAKGALVCLINDAESAAACHAAGEGATVTLSLGGKSDGMPFPCTARVEKLTDGVFTLTGPMGAGNPGNLGPTALIDIDGVRVIVVTRKMQALDQAIIRHVGIEPSSCPILALKSSVHFRADFGPIAEQVIVAIAPGPVVADPAVLNFRHVRADIRRRPRAA